MADHLTPAEFVQYVDRLMVAEKLIVGIDQPQTWRDGRDEGCLRVKYPIEVEGEQRGEFLIIDAFPNESPVRYHVMVTVADRTVDRLRIRPRSPEKTTLRPSLCSVTMEAPRIWPAGLSIR